MTASDRADAKAESLPYADAGDDASAGPSVGRAGGTPRWVKGFGLAALIVVLLIGALVLLGGGSHGPGRHTGGDAPADDAVRNAPPPEVQERGHTGPPPGIEH
jgi:hypothetical protein